jgi:enamine deaminase RidA (YjgF/YER057c/UK114 family)
MSIERILHQGAPSPRGPYSSAVRAGDFIYVSGMGPVDEDDRLSPGDIQHQTRLVLTNLRLQAAILKAPSLNHRLA